VIELPDFARAHEYENAFYQSCSVQRISKILAHYELYKLVSDLPGALVECGVFKGCSLLRFAAFRELFESPGSRRLVPFDTFGSFPEAKFPGDEAVRARFVEAAGDQSVSQEQLLSLLAHKGVDQRVELVAGDLRETLPDYVVAHPELRVCLVNLDTDLYEPAKVALEQLYPRLVPGGVMIVDDYGVFPGETEAVDEYFEGRGVRIRKFPFATTPAYIVKE
jgi:hypothetical protein